MRKSSSDGAGTLRPATSHVKQKSGESSRASAEPHASPWEDTTEGLQIDLKTQVVAASSGLYLMRALFDEHGLYGLMHKHPLTEFHLARLCEHLMVGLNTALDKVESHQEEAATRKQKGEQR